MTRKIGIEGMSCGHCVKAVTSALEAIDGISDVNVSLDDNCAEFTAEESVTDDMIKEAIAEEGYEVKFED